MDNDIFIAEAEAKVLEDFKTATADLARKCGAEYFAGRKGYAWVSDLYVDTKSRANIEVWVDILGEPFQVRLCLDGPERLQVGWGCNNLLTTHLNSRNDMEIKAHDFITEVFRHEAEWRSALLSLDLTPVLDAKARKKEADEMAAKIENENAMAAFDKAGVKVGTVFVAGRWRYEVTRIIGSRVRLGKVVMYKVDIGKKLLRGEWEVQLWSDQ